MRSVSILSFVFMAGGAMAQQQGIGLPPASPAASVSRTLGDCKVTVNYSSPGAKGRKIFGGIVPLGKVWRTGANQATTIEFTQAVKFGGKEVPEGTYGLFTIPEKDHWTVIINNDAKQWGAYEYKESKDVARAEVKATTTADSVEMMDIRLAAKTRNTMNLEICWEKTMISVPIEIDVDGPAIKKIEEALAKKGDDPFVLFEAADYYMQSGKNLDKAVTLYDKSLAKNPLSYVMWHKSMAEFALGKKDAAMKTINAAIEAAKKDPQFAGVVGEMEATKLTFEGSKK